MRIWFNRVSESRRSMVDIDGVEFRIGRDHDNHIVLPSPLVSRHHAVVRVMDDLLELENVGLNSCLIGDTELLGGQSASFAKGTKIRIWPFTLSFETETATHFSRSELESHLRSIMAALELQIHQQLLERLDLYEFETERGANHDSILLLENNIFLL